MSKRWIAALVGLTVVAALGLFVLAWPSSSAQGTNASAGGAGQGGTAVPDLPGGLVSWQANGAGGRYVAPVLEGEAPVLPTLGVVRTDTDCAADAEGLSHCHNQIELAGGAWITIQDNHNMMVNPCLGPGERVSVEPLSAGWVVIRTRAGA